VPSPHRCLQEGGPLNFVDCICELPAAKEDAKRQADSVLPSAGELWTWAIYNFVVFAVAPYLWFRRRYSATQLNLRSTDRWNDLLVIVVVMAIESLVELSAFPGIFQLSAHQLLIAAPLAFGVFLIGTVLPTMVLIYAILVPRYLKLTGSFVTTVLLGGGTYAGMHIVEG
jgi:hypothetical protein